MEFRRPEAAHIILRSHYEFVASLVNQCINTPVEDQPADAIPNGQISESRAHVH